MMSHKLRDEIRELRALLVSMQWPNEGNKLRNALAHAYPTATASAPPEEGIDQPTKLTGDAILEALKAGERSETVTSRRPAPSVLRPEPTPARNPAYVEIDQGPSDQ